MSARNIMLGVRNAIGFDPTAISGLKLWLRADVLALADGTAVSSWTDSSGLGNHATQETGANQPLFKTAILNGKPVIRFDGTNDRLDTSGSASLNFTEATIFVVRNNQANPCALLIAQSGGTVNNAFIMYDKRIYHHSAPGVNKNLSHQNSPAGFFVQSGRFGVAPAELELWLDGVGSTQSNGTSGTPSDYTVINRAATVGSMNPPGPEKLNGDIAEIIVYDSALSEWNRKAVEQWLGQKYAITVAP